MEHNNTLLKETRTFTNIQTTNQTAGNKHTLPEQQSTGYLGEWCSIEKVKSVFAGSKCKIIIHITELDIALRDVRTKHN